MSYINAAEILPEDLIREIQRYVDGKVLYIPRKDENILSWGEKSGARDRLAKRNKEIVNRYFSGATAAELGSVYFLSEKRIQRIIHEYESSIQEENGGSESE